ncbi:hypothetical protein HOLleu_20466 [Holothuria leucospilota]|uniref:Uncharacterized protein n=1 Tax=Holothuria leucospilota TaxID=206669 RepID=A0A9Q1H5Q5_HOLLE|nr:hypothetical protein HOLleu_20466 [Holothuria leucospilota]
MVKIPETVLKVDKKKTELISLQSHRASERCLPNGVIEADSTHRLHSCLGEQEAMKKHNTDSSISTRTSSPSFVLWFNVMNVLHEAHSSDHTDVVTLRKVWESNIIKAELAGAIFLGVRDPPESHGRAVKLKITCLKKWLFVFGRATLLGNSVRLEYVG